MSPFDTDNPADDSQPSVSMTELTEREKLIAQEAAKLAVKMVMDEFYKNVGRNFVQKFFILVGAGAVGFAIARGWITPPK